MVFVSRESLVELLMSLFTGNGENVLIMMAYQIGNNLFVIVATSGLAWLPQNFDNRPPIVVLAKKV